MCNEQRRKPCFTVSAQSAFLEFVPQLKDFEPQLVPAVLADDLIIRAGHRFAHNAALRTYETRLRIDDAPPVSPLPLTETDAERAVAPRRQSEALVHAGRVALVPKA